MEQFLQGSNGYGAWLNTSGAMIDGTRYFVQTISPLPYLPAAISRGITFNIGRKPSLMTAFTKFV
jgi:hypothetical protein